jgi:hypothetical protein
MKRWSKLHNAGSKKVVRRGRRTMIDRPIGIWLCTIAVACGSQMIPFSSVTSAQDAAGINASVLKGRPYSPYADRAFSTQV